jgi:hypothetical protein
MNRLWKIPSAVADLTLGTVIVLVQLTLQAREQARLPPPTRSPRARARA